MRFETANAEFETWLCAQMPIVESDLTFKHAQMRSEPFR